MVPKDLLNTIQLGPNSLRKVHMVARKNTSKSHTHDLGKIIVSY